MIPVTVTTGKTDQLKILDQASVSLESSYYIVVVLTGQVDVFVAAMESV